MKKRVLKPLLLLLLALWGAPARGQHLGQIIDSLNRSSWYYTSWNNGWGGLIREWICQDLLHHMATEKQFIDFAQRRTWSAPLRLTAMRALIDRRHPLCKAIVLHNMTDSSCVTVQSYDVIYSDYTQNMYVEWLMQGRGEGWLSVADSLEIDSAVLFTPAAARLDYTRRLLRRLDTRPEYEPRVRQLYVSEHVAEALPLLARYRREADKPLVTAALMQYAVGLDKKGAREPCKSPRGNYEGATNEGLLAVREWPDEDFKAALLTVRDYEARRHYYDYARIKYLFEALMAYDSPWAYRQIDRTLRMNRLNEYYRQYFHSAMKKHYNVRYQPLLNQWPYTPRNEFGDGFE